MLRIPPTSCLSLDVSLCALLERDRSRCLELLRTILGFALLEWINFVYEQQALRSGSLSGVGETNSCKSAQAHLARFSVKHVTQAPALCAAAANAQIEPAAVGIETWFRRGRDLTRAQSI
jgi:hypothetical protein